jgi:clathrin heavy chain
MSRGHFAELIALLESGIGLERAHMGIFTALGEMFANHEPAKLMEHLKLFSTRVNIPRLITICDRQMLWRELTFLYEKYDEFDNALEVMMAHDAVAWEHVRFKDVAVKCSTVDIFYKAIQHYFDFHPELVVDLLKVRSCSFAT